MKKKNESVSETDSSNSLGASGLVSSQKAYWLIRRVKTKLKEDLGETSLKELKSEVKTMIKKVQK